MNEHDRKSWIAALIRERVGYEQKGDKERMAAVDEQLRQLGHEAAAPAKRAERRPAAQRAETRTVIPDPED